MRLKRMLAGVLVMLMIPCSSMLGTFAVDGAQESTTPTEEETVAPTKPPVTAQDIGMEKYVKLLEKTYYKGDLGASYSKKETLLTFRSLMDL